MSQALTASNHLDEWYAENKELFLPPVCNKLMHREQLSVMFVGGPNLRTDFHLEEGSEFFWMYRGSMELPTIQQGKRKLVKIKEGEVFCLPSRVPHSPQRTDANSLGLVIERQRYEEKGELDGLRWYTDFDKCDQILWERYFHCGDLGKDLVPVVMAYKSSDECKTNTPGANIVANPPFEQDMDTVVPDPFNLNDWIAKNQEIFCNGGTLNLFGDDHPDKEFKVMVVGGESEQTTSWAYDTWLMMLKGNACVELNGETTELKEKCCCVIRPNSEYTVKRENGSIGFVITQDPMGNKK